MSAPCPVWAARTAVFDVSPCTVIIDEVGAFEGFHIVEAQRYAAFRIPGSSRWQVWDRRKNEGACQLGAREWRPWLATAARSILADRAARPERRAILKALKEDRKARAIARAQSAAAPSRQYALI